MTHTPGLWEVRQTGATSEIHVAGERTYYIATVGVGISDSNTKANARLIAKAPEMLIFVREYLARLDVGSAQDELAFMARALLREIEGKEQTA